MNLLQQTITDRANKQIEKNANRIENKPDVEKNIIRKKIIDRNEFVLVSIENLDLSEYDSVTDMGIINIHIDTVLNPIHTKFNKQNDLPYGLC